VRFRVLGLVEIDSDDGEVHILGRRQERCVLAILLLEAGRVVSVDRLCQLLWDDDPPLRARRAVHAQVARIRSVLAQAGAHTAGVELASHRNGYLLQVDPDTVDVHRFRRLCDEAANTTNLGRREQLLRDALALWRGPALHNAITSDRLRQRLCTELEEQRLSAQEELIGTGLELGRVDLLLPELARLGADNPVRERLVGLHMRALYRQGRTTEALEVYRQVRTRLANELGLDPGPDLQRLHQAMLRGDPVPEPDTGRDPGRRAIGRLVVPAQLPLAPAGFTGRLEHLRELDTLLAADGEQSVGTATVAVISAIAGTAGVGKTALAVHWAHRVRDRFPDGQLYVNLRGYDPDQPMTSGEALARFLAALGVAASDIPVEVDERAARYRTQVADRRMLIVLDNAATVEQIRPLLPGTPSCAVVVTSRDSLAAPAARARTRPARHPSTAVNGPARSGVRPRPAGPGRAAVRPAPRRRTRPHPRCLWPAWPTPFLPKRSGPPRAR
jgi:DNA-binding SARP family transcriptional activator